MSKNRQRSIATLLKQARAVALNDRSCEREERWNLVWELRRRPVRLVFDTCVEWSRSSRVLLRVFGVDVLGQLDPGTFVFANETIPILLERLDDKCVAVIESSLYGFGHLNCGPLEPLCTLVRHRSADIRYALAFALGKRHEPLARTTLIRLSRDRHREVRNWAIFGLGQLCAIDTPAIREALFARLNDRDEEVRYEAMMGLAMKGDRRMIDRLFEEIDRCDDVWIGTIEAISHIPDPIFIATLQRLLVRHPTNRIIREALVAFQALL